jgi:hypothetical protein
VADALLKSHGWTDGIDGNRVAALQAVAREMRDKGLEFDPNPTQAQIEALTANMMPQEIIEHWKSSQASTTGDASEANEAFIRINGGSSSIFDR